MPEQVTSAALAKTPLHGWHAEHGGRMVDFAGWSMPVHYGSIVEEHTATRNAVGLFDVSHMARFQFRGPGAESLLDRLVTRRVRGMPVGRICYALATNESGGILDDVLVYRVAGDSPGVGSFQLVVNASNRGKIWSWIDAQRDARDEVDIHDATVETAMIAVQGPGAGELMRSVAAADPVSLRYYSSATFDVLGVRSLVSRTGYTGEDGWEVVVPAAVGLEIWVQLLDRGRSLGARPAGLGCRDTLRLEAAMPLYGHELSVEIDPFQAGLGFAVELEDHAFVGREALERRKQDPQALRRVGWEIGGKRPAREGSTVLADGRQIGRVTSGTFAPTLGRPIAMGYVEPAFAAPGAEMTIDVRGHALAARVVKLPFYRRPTR